MPALSVLLPARDASRFLSASLDSLWRQTFTDFEVIAVDDGSTDGTSELLERAAATESRLRVEHTPPRGLPTALNLALERSSAPIVARHDADDLSHPRRFERQLEFLTNGSRHDVAGCRVRLFPSSAIGAGMRRWASWHNALLTHDAMAREVLIDSPLAHATAVFDRAWLDRVGGWRERGWPEDLDLWIRLLEAGARLAKLPAFLYAWRQHRSSATWRDPRYARKRFVELKLDALTRWLARDSKSVTVVGTGTSLDRCRTALEVLPVPVRVVSARRPSVGLLSGFEPPLILVYVSAAARGRWRELLERGGFEERRDFWFVA